MDVMSMCSSSPTSNQTAPRKIPEFASIPHAQSLPSPPLMDMVNEKKGSSLPPLTSITAILQSPVPPLREINPTPLPPPIIAPKPNHDSSSSDTVTNHNLYNQSSTPQSPPSRVNYLQPPEPISTQRSSPSSSSSSYLLSPSTSQSPNDTNHSMWSRQPPSLPTTSYYRQSYPPPPQYSYTPQSHYSHSSVNTSMASEYPPPYATSNSYTSSGNHINGEEDSPYYPQPTTEQSLAKMGKVVDHCNQIAHFASQYRDMRVNYNSWNGAVIPQINESHLTGIINRAYDVLNILSGLKSELTARPSSAETNQDEIDLIRKQRTGASTRTKYRKRSKRAAPPGRCHSCNISETPEWRRGPDGARTLCNACGLHFAKITRKRALSAMQAEQQQAASRSSNINSTTSPIPDNNGNSFNNHLSNNNNNSSMPTPGASDVERESMIEILDD